jgi:hypothetical protein
MDRRVYFLSLLIASGCAAVLNQYGLGADDANDQVTTEHATGGPAKRAPRFGVTSYAPEPLCGSSVCWTSRSNPTARQVDEIGEQRDLAAQVRELNPALAAAEASGCSGIEPEDRDISPFYHREDIVSVSQVAAKVKTGKGVLVRTSGARVKFRGVPGLSSQWLQREVDCHLLRAAAVDYSIPKMSYCPLMLEGVEARVLAAGTGFVVEITAEDAGTTEEILRRAYALLESVEPWASVVLP